MIDPKLLRQSAAEVAANLARRGFEFDADAYLALEERRKALQVETEQLQSERNASAKSIGKAKAQGEDIQPLLAAVKDLGYGEGYRYAHDEEGAVALGETYFPDDMQPAKYYHPVARGLEIRIREKLEDIERRARERKRQAAR